MDSTKSEVEKVLTPDKFRKSPTLSATHPAVVGFDSFEFNPDLMQKSMSWLRSWSLGQQEVIPATVFSYFDLGWFVRPDSHEKKESLRWAKAEAEKKWKQVSSEGSLEALVAETRQNSTRVKALKLLDFAKRKKADIIVTASRAHSRSGFTGIGSFSESLLSLSTTPVLLMTEALEEARPIRNIFNPSDLSTSSQVTFKRIVKIAKRFNAAITLFHFIDVEAGPYAIGVPWGYELAWLVESWHTHEEAMQKKGEQWAEWARLEGVACNFVKVNNSGSLQDTIMKVSRQYGADLITINIKRGPMSQIILGRTVRGLLANATCPILAIHSKEVRSRHHS